MRHLLAIGAAFLAATSASAHVQLATSTPAANATADKIAAIDLRFSGAIDPASLTVELAMTDMPGMSNHAPMRITGFKTQVAPDKTAATLALPRALPAGTYLLTWKATAADGHPASGTLPFKAR